MKIITAGRTDFEEFFSISGCLTVKKLTHNPFLAFCATPEGVEVKIVQNAHELCQLPAETPVMAQWPGQWRSDFIQFTVGDVCRYIEGLAQE